MKTASNDDLIYLVPTGCQTLAFSRVLVSQGFKVVVLTLYEDEEISLRKTK